MDAEKLMKIDRDHIWHPFTQMADWVREEQIIIERAEGNYLIDVQGRRFFDGVSSLWVNLFGHRRREIDEKIREQLSRVAHSTFLGLTHVPAIELTEKLMGFLPQGLSRVFYSDNGSTAMEIALKMAFQYWKQKGNGGEEKTTFLTLTGAYHGDTIGSVSAGGIDLFHSIFRPLLFETVKVPGPYCFRCPYDLTLDKCGLHCAEVLREKLMEEKERVAAVVVEPLVQGAAGMIVHPEGFLRRVREAADEAGVLLIVDEVATGFGRTGRMFAVEHEGVVPDIMALAKGITGGYLPLAATVTTEEVYSAFLGRYEEFKTFFHGHSYTANPLGCAAAIATLEIFEREDVLGHVQEVSSRLSERLQEVKDHPNVGDVRQKGLMVGIEIVRDRETKEPFPPELKVGQRVIRKTRERGLIIRPLGDVIVLMPPLSTTLEEVDTLCDVTFWAMEEVLRETVR
ncbi:MAG: adenosylmethionine--8-amino-7-oxononanoate transaminase [Deltaproteobacteria bacterium]|nr:MAG: adenosylmethionine--8-amino-7-oxononanoate transaminase [Deltaproteobacteria bacterium]